MCHRNHSLGLQPAELKARSVVLAPEEEFYEAAGKRHLSMAPAERLIERARTEFGVICELAVWDPGGRIITPRGQDLPHPEQPRSGSSRADSSRVDSVSDTTTNR
jgi:hypothetical protein